mmetsp:Transcript_10853/g.30022  ORF Transcript_10853/g.30022 Transcript_10853/m.30022 type:complete len:197 (+) Transcript_10853:280-870(+)|eukprot:CAMPEP_0168750762 /NCGR_PEP_ID=MMETSP0724-20121128/17456_1 /TAXON_ID=265536 /ORGANISM="Amphiprora sp., Strain CCMP467" /LENGTH=196 /DNA_ID=CAMNT_0008798827 /DNA_START=225 /DNA_END=815 /DNA_ORIENTATION=+
MVKELTYDKNRIILETWGEVQRISDYHVVIGSSLYQKFFNKCPSAKVLFGWSLEDDPNSDKVLKSRNFLSQSSLYVKLLDTVMDMLGPDIDMLTDILEELGEKHWKMYGVCHEMYGPMGEALLETLQEKLGEEKFTREISSVWLDVWVDLAGDMTRRELKAIELQKQRLAKTMEAGRTRTPTTSSVPVYGDAKRKA